MYCNLKSNRNCDIFMRTVTVTFSKSIWMGAWGCCPALGVICISRSVICGCAMWSSGDALVQTHPKAFTTQYVLFCSRGMGWTRAVLAESLSSVYWAPHIPIVPSRLRRDRWEASPVAFPPVLDGPRSGFWELTISTIC